MRQTLCVSHWNYCVSVGHWKLEMSRHFISARWKTCLGARPKARHAHRKHVLKTRVQSPNHKIIGVIDLLFQSSSLPKFIRTVKPYLIKHYAADAQIITRKLYQKSNSSIVF